MNDAVLSELQALNSHMLRALDALTFLTAHATNQPPAQPSPTFSPVSATRPGYVPNFSATGDSSGHSQNVSRHPSQSRPRVSPHQPQPPNPPADDVSVSDSITSGISITSIRTSRTLRDAVQDMVKDSKSKTIKLPQLEDRLQEPSYVRDWMERTLSLVAAHSYYSPLLDSSGHFVSPPPSEENKFLMHEVYGVLPKSLKTVVRLSPDLKHSAAAFFEYIRKFSIPASLNNQVAEHLHKEFLDLKWDPSKQRLFEYVASFADLVERLSDTPSAPSAAAIVNRWISSLPASIFDKLQHDFNESKSLPAGWSSTMPLKDLYEETNTYIQRHHPLILHKKQPDVKVRYASPSGFNFTTWKKHLASKFGTAEFASLKATIPSDACPFCLFRPGSQQHHLMSDCNTYKKLTRDTNNSSNPSASNYTVVFQ